MPFSAFSSSAEALLMSSGSFFAAGAFGWGLGGSFGGCAHAVVVPAPRANATATRSATRRLMMLLLGTSLVPSKRSHRQQGRSRWRRPAAASATPGPARHLDDCQVDVVAAL